MQSEMDIFCPSCGYNLRGIDSEHCPECGYDTGYLRLTEPQLPWMRRDDSGFLKAYLQTVLMVGVQKRKLAEELIRPTCYRSSQLFRWITVLLSYGPLVPITIGLFVLDPGSFFSESVAAYPRFAIGATLVIHLCIVLFLSAATGSASYFFCRKRIPIEQQNRAIALSYYCCAPLLLVPVASLLLLGMLWCYQTGALVAALVCGLCGVYLVIRAFLAWIIRLDIILKGVIQRKNPEWSDLHPPLLMLFALLIFVGVPLVIGYIALVFCSLW